MLQQLLEACCRNFMGISLPWAHCWGFRLSCLSTWQLCVVWCWQSSRHRVWAVGVVLEFCHWDAESQGMGLEQPRACLESMHPVGPDVLVCIPLGNEILPSTLYFWVPAVPYSHTVLLGCCWKFRHSLIQFFLTNPNSNDMRLLEKEQVGWLRGGFPIVRR